jgi:predicted DNA-binding transcriptional regulator AlpA
VIVHDSVNLAAMAQRMHVETAVLGAITRTDGFPRPLRTEPSTVWEWSEVVAWGIEHGAEHDLLRAWVGTIGEAPPGITTLSTSAQLAAHYGVPRRQFSEWTQRADFPDPHLDGNRLLWDPPMVDHWVRTVGEGLPSWWAYRDTEVLSLRGLAKELGMAHSSVQAWASKPGFPSPTIKGGHLYRVDEVRAWRDASSARSRS